MTAQQFESITPSLPSHQEELAVAHQDTGGTGIPAPAEDRGISDQDKYAGGCM